LLDWRARFSLCSLRRREATSQTPGFRVRPASIKAMTSLSGVTDVRYCRCERLRPRRKMVPGRGGSANAGRIWWRGPGKGGPWAVASGQSRFPGRRRAEYAAAAHRGRHASPRDNDGRRQSLSGHPDFSRRHLCRTSWGWGSGQRPLKRGPNRGASSGRRGSRARRHRAEWRFWSRSTLATAPVLARRSVCRRRG